MTKHFSWSEDQAHHGRGCGGFSEYQGGSDFGVCDEERLGEDSVASVVAEDATPSGVKTKTSPYMWGERWSEEQTHHEESMACGSGSDKCHCMWGEKWSEE